MNQPPDWSPARPEKVPEPSWAPASLALGSALMLWGLITTWIIGATGLAVFVVSLVEWIGEIRHERKS